MQVNLFALLGLIGVFLLILTALMTKTECDQNPIVCPDGTIINADPLNDCQLPKCPNIELIPYCTTGVISVQESNNLIRTVFNNKSIIYGKQVIECLNESINNECLNYERLNWEGINCSQLIKPEAFKCPTEYNKLGNYSWINCTQKPAYCEPKLAQWVTHNCGIEIIN